MHIMLVVVQPYVRVSEEGKPLLPTCEQNMACWLPPRRPAATQSSYHCATVPFADQPFHAHAWSANTRITIFDEKRKTQTGHSDSTFHRYIVYCIICVAAPWQAAWLQQLQLGLESAAARQPSHAVDRIGYVQSRTTSNDRDESDGDRDGWAGAVEQAAARAAVAEVARRQAGGFAAAAAAGGTCCCSVHRLST